jgi:hypothetical protein
LIIEVSLNPGSPRDIPLTVLVAQHGREPWEGEQNDRRVFAS